MLEYLCEQGADVHQSDNESHTLIHWATGHIKIYEFSNENIIDNTYETIDL
jgi:ankyrin repeat protein